MTLHDQKSLKAGKRVELAGQRWPRGMRRDTAAAYLGVSESQFDRWVARGLMPSPKRIEGVVVWDRYRLDHAFETMADNGSKEDTWADLNGGGSPETR